MSERDLSIPPLNNALLDYSKFNSDILVKKKLLIIPMRAPLENPEANNLLNEEELWTWTEIKSEISEFIRKKYRVNNCKDIAVIDLTGTKVDSEKYYKGSTLYEKHGIVYNKLAVNGSSGREPLKVPVESLFNLFNQTANRMLELGLRNEAEGNVRCSGNHSTECDVCDADPVEDSYEDLQVLLIHCTHGLDRTGLFICNFLVTQCDIESETAIETFEEARGHQMRYNFYKNHIRSLDTTYKISE